MPRTGIVRALQVLALALVSGIPHGVAIAALRSLPYDRREHVLAPLLADALPQSITLLALGVLLWLGLSRLAARRERGRRAALLVTLLAGLAPAVQLVWLLNHELLPGKFAPVSLVTNALLAVVALVLLPRVSTLLDRWHERVFLPARVPVLPLLGLGWIPLATHLAGHVRHDDGPDILVLLIDVLRADHLGCYGYERPTSPNIDRLAADAVLFEQAISASTFTKTSVASLFTGRYPHHHLVYEGSREDTPEHITSDVLSARYTTLAEHLFDHGLETVAWVQNVQISDYMGFDQGFAEYHVHAGDIETIAGKYEAWRERWAPRLRYFAYLHFLDLHAPYLPPAELRGRFGPDTETIRAQNHDTWRTFRNGVVRGEIPLPPEDLAALEARHDETLVHVDEWIGRILDDLKASGRYDDTLIVLLADHGDAFWEHGTISHSQEPYEELVHVPLIVKLPSSRNAGARVTSMVSLVDLAPTLIDYVGAPAPADMDGESFLPLLLDPAAQQDPRSRFAEIHRVVGVRTERWKYIARPTGPAELYDLTADPGEQRECSAEHPDVAARFAEAVRAAVEQRERAGAAEEVEVDPAALEMLEDLGYL